MLPCRIQDNFSWYTYIYILDVNPKPGLERRPTIFTGFKLFKNNETNKSGSGQHGHFLLVYSCPSDHTTKRLYEGNSTSALIIIAYILIQMIDIIIIQNQKRSLVSCFGDYLSFKYCFLQHRTCVTICPPLMIEPSKLRLLVKEKLNTDKRLHYKKCCFDLR